MKIEQKDNLGKCLLSLECKIMQNLMGNKGIPKVYHFHLDDAYGYLVKRFNLNFFK